MTEKEEIKMLRFYLWLRHGHHGLYGDDGEMQCSQCMLDFKRDTVEHIQQSFDKQAQLGRDKKIRGNFRSFYKSSILYQARNLQKKIRKIKKIKKVIMDELPPMIAWFLKKL